MTNDDLINRFAYHRPPNQDVADTHETIREACLQAAERINWLAPEGREKSLAITKLEEAMFWANAAIARVDEDGERL